MTDQSKQKKVVSLINSMDSHFKRALPHHFDSARFTRIAMTAISKQPELAKATQTSLLGALMTFAQLGLEPNTPLGHAYLVSFNNEVTPIIGYKGRLDLAYRTDNFSVIDVLGVYECDEFDYHLGLNPDLKHKPGQPKDGKPKGEPVLFYAFYKMKNGGSRFRVWTREECLAHGRKHSKSFNNKKMPWQTNTNAMCKKTVLNDLLSLAPMSPEDRQMWSIANQDGAVVNFDPETDETEVIFQAPQELKEGSIDADVIDEDLL